jgi:hypothetical protein
MWCNKDIGICPNDLKGKRGEHFSEKVVRGGDMNERLNTGRTNIDKEE